MKIYTGVVLLALAVCLGCGSNEGKPSSEKEVKLLIGKPQSNQTTQENDATGAEGGTNAAGVNMAAVEKSRLTPKEVLEKMVAAYKNATSYIDKGRVRLTGELPVPSSANGASTTQPLQLSTPMSMSIERPNKVFINANQGTAICDGKTLYEYVEPLPDQVLEKPAPQEITIESIFTEPILADAMAQGPTQYYTWIPIQTILLLANDPLKTLLYNAENFQLLKPGEVEGHPCYRVQIDRHDGKAVFWIDAESFVLRRFEYPLETMKQDFRNELAKDLSVVADFEGATLNSTLPPKTFSFQPPKNTQIVTTIAPLQIHMLGKKSPEFFFEGMDNKPITLKSLAGKTVVIDFWASWNMQCRNSLGMLNQVVKGFEGDDRVVFFACNTDRKAINNEELEKIMTEMKVSIPICRDPQDFAKKGFKIPGVPTTVVIGPDGIIQDFQSNLDPRRQMMLQRTVQAVADGVDVYPSQLEMFEAIRTDYGQIIQRMLTEDLFIDPQSIMQMMPIPGVAIRSVPRRAQLLRLWNCPNLGIPGNILVLNDSPTPRILVCHDSRAVAELDTQGKVIEDHRFTLPDDAESAITNLRTGTTATGQRFYVGFAPSFKQFFFIDEKFNIQWRFPTSENQAAPDGIADVQIADLDGDGTPEILVGYRGEAGVRAISLDRKELWANREATGVTKMAVVPQGNDHPPLLLCTTDQCALVGLDSQGKIVKKIDLGDNRRLYWIDVASLDPNGKIFLCGLSAPDIGKNEALGFSLDGDLLWAYELPDGTPGTIIDRIISGPFFPVGFEQWVLLGADSSIHFLSEMGRPIEGFNYGSFVAGIATVKLGNYQALLISSPTGVEAISLQSY